MSRTGARRLNTPEGARSSQRRFLLEFELVGDIGAASEAAECTVYEVRHWRATDPMFERDFALAAQAHVRQLGRIVADGAGNAARPESVGARHLLASQGEYVGMDGRLDVRRWRDVLLAFLLEIGIDPTDWEPPDTACGIL